MASRGVHSSKSTAWQEVSQHQAWAGKACLVERESGQLGSLRSKCEVWVQHPQPTFTPCSHHLLHLVSMQEVCQGRKHEDFPLTRQPSLLKLLSLVPSSSPSCCLATRSAQGASSHRRGESSQLMPGQCELAAVIDKVSVDLGVGKPKPSEVPDRRHQTIT